MPPCLSLRDWHQSGKSDSRICSHVLYLNSQPRYLHFTLNHYNIHISGHGSWYAVTVIDYYSRYLLACHLTFSYSVIQVMYALKQAREEAERVGGPLAKRPFLVTDNLNPVPRHNLAITHLLDHLNATAFTVHRSRV